MKIALLLTGQLRTVNLLKNLFFNTIISKYDTDVFLSINTDNKSQNTFKNNTLTTNLETINEIISFFKPIKYFISDNFEPELNRLLKTENKKFVIKHIGIYAQYYIVHKAYQILKEYIEESKVEYDLIIRLRFDQFIFPENHLLFEKLDKKGNNDIIYNDNNINIIKNDTIEIKMPFYQPIKNEVYVLGFGRYTHFNYVNDQFFYHNSDQIKNFLNFYSKLYQYIDIAVNREHNVGMCIYEHVFYHFLKLTNLAVKKADLYSQFIREL
jgi:hypothetical protein